jgi:hypothetical protein
MTDEKRFLTFVFKIVVKNVMSANWTEVCLTR